MATLISLAKMDIGTCWLDESCLSSQHQDLRNDDVEENDHFPFSLLGLTTINMEMVNSTTKVLFCEWLNLNNALLEEVWPAFEEGDSEEERA